MHNSTQTSRIDEHKLFFPVLRLITNSSAALAGLHKKHGELVFVRFLDKKLLFVSKPEHIEQIFSQEAKGLLNRDCLYEAKKPVFGDGLANSKGELWVNQRRLMQPFFNKESVKGWQGLIANETEMAVNRFKVLAPAEINLTREMKALVQRIISKILFGDLLNHDNSADLTESIDIIMKGLVPQLASGLFAGKLVKTAFFLQNKKFEKAIMLFTNFVEQGLHEDKNKDGDALLTLLSRATVKKSGYAMTETLLRDEAVNLFLAGQDTTINTLIWFFYLIGKHEDIHQLITDEVLLHLSEPLTPENLLKLTYTKAAVQETLRLYPAATALTRQPVVDDFELDGRRISRDTTILISIYMTHHDSLFWEQPDAFYPEHFANSDLVSKRHRFAFLPFGGGIHNCIGRNLAELEMMTIIVSLLRAFSFKTDMTVNKAISITMKPNRDVFVSIKPFN